MLKNVCLGEGERRAEVETMAVKVDGLEDVVGMY